MKKLLLSGLRPAATEAEVGAWLGGFGPVVRVSFVREGNDQAPVAVVEMNITDDEAFYLTSRLTRYWHEGSLVSASLLNR